MRVKPATADPEPRLLRLFNSTEIAKVLHCSRSYFYQMRASEEFPPPDLTVGRMALWKVSTVEAWIDSRATSHKKG